MTTTAPAPAAGPSMPSVAPDLVHPAVLVLPVEGMISPRTEQAVEASLARLPGVSAGASYAGKTVRVEFDRARCAIADIVDRLDALGLRVLTKQEAAARDAAESGGDAAAGPPSAVARAAAFVRRYDRLALAAAGGLCLLGGFLVHAAGGPQAVRVPLLLACFALCGWHTAVNSLRELRMFHFDIDVLMLVAAVGAAAIGRWEEGGMLLLLFAVGTAGEEMAMDKARNAIHALAKLAPETATVRDAAGVDRAVRVADLKVGDRVVVRPFDRVPADGTVAEGTSAVDQAPITGESVPVEKQPGSPVFAGTINGEGLLVATVTKPAGESTLARVVRLVSEAQASKSPTQLFTAKIERFYVPGVLVATACLIVLPPVLGLGRWATWFYRAMAFLTAASPCALAIGTPAAVLAGIARSARMGVLIKGGAHLENLGRVRVVALDKTGTLTRGRPAVTDVVPTNGRTSADELLRVAAAVERSSSHPLAKAIADEATARRLPDAAATEVGQVPAKGLTGTVEGRAVKVGRPAWAADGATNETGAAWAEAAGRLAAEGKSMVGVSVDGRPAGLIALADQPRPAAAAAVAALKAAGVGHVVMLTGDALPVARLVAGSVGIDAADVRADLLPEDKGTAVSALQERYGPLAMVGDGVNDAPAMALATVGVAMGGAGTDVALEAADVALMGDDLAKLPEAIALSRASRRVIAQNLVIALGTIAAVGPMAALGLVPLGLAVVLHEGSTVVVVLNALRLLRWRP
ncbi:MAG TPA: heavy metal translocating P-type ATPase [Humisphaera sp.]